MVILEFFSAILLLLNKFFLVAEKKATGWLVGIGGSILLTLYLYLETPLQPKVNFWIMIVGNSSLALIMLYAYLIVMAKGESRLKKFLTKWNLAFKIIVIIFTLLVCTFLFIKVFTADLVLEQFILSVSSLSGTLLMSFNKKLLNLSGWILYFVAHTMSAYTMFNLHPIAYTLGICQVISCGFAIYGIKKETQTLTAVASP